MPKRFIISAPVQFHFIGESKTEALKRFVEILVSVNTLVSGREGITLPPEQKVEDLPIEERKL